MSGGGLCNYKQFEISTIIEAIEKEIKSNKPNGYPYSEMTINHFKRAIEKLKVALIYANRIDWLVSGDDSEKGFHKRLRDDLDNYLMERRKENEKYLKGVLKKLEKRKLENEEEEVV